MLVGTQAEAVEIDTGSWPGHEVLEGLDLVEVGTWTRSEAILTVQLQLDVVDDGVLVIRQTLTIRGVGGTRCTTFGIATESEGTVVEATGVLDGPGEEAAGMVEVEADVLGAQGRCWGNGFTTSELQLGDEVFVLVLSEAASLICIKEDVICVERCQGGEAGINTGSGHDGGGGKIEVELDFVVLHIERNGRRSLVWYFVCTLEDMNETKGRDIDVPGER